MCILLDADCFSRVFDTSNREHHEFEAVRRWILKDGRIVIGGSEYKRQLRNAPRILAVVNELRRAGKVRILSDKLVDACEEGLKKKIVHRDFDDAHLIAIINESGCRVLCTGEKRAMPFVTDSKLYKKGVSRPKIYKRNAHKRMLERLSCD